MLIREFYVDCIPPILVKDLFLRSDERQELVSSLSDISP